MGRSKFKGGLGFRDLECFNLAMLAKQGWRLFHFRDSLAARVLKYFPQSSFLEARVGPRASFAWRSLCNSRALLEEGMVWRVGDGTSIKIWKDKWVLSSSSFKIQSSVCILSPDTKVSSLIDVDTRWWDLNLIHSIVTPTKAARICSLPLSPRGHPDQIIWSGTSNSTFSVRSAYHIGESSKATSHRVLWKKLWSLRVPSVIKNFLWRVCHNLLPTKLNLHRKQIVPNYLCPMCGAQPESTGHILWECDSATAVWMECSKKIQKLSIGADDGVHLFMQLVEKLDLEELMLVSWLAHRIWLRWNTMVFGGNLSPPALLV
jgi:hypothetical protein